MKLPGKTLEKKLLNSGYDQVIGIDEVGMGCLAGPVVVCAVAFNKKFFQLKDGHSRVNKKLQGVRDSKLLLPHQREKFAIELLKEKSLRFKIAYCFPKTIDKINIYQAARLAMRRAITRLVYSQESIVHRKKKLLANDHKLKTVVLVDGPHKIDGLKMEQRAIVKGDQKVFTISCASILAKVFRDKIMVRYAKKFPGYGFEKHKGYGTKEHLASLTKFGPCAIHRCSFAPVAKLL